MKLIERKHYLDKMRKTFKTRHKILDSRRIYVPINYTTPCSNIALATFKKPAIFAPATRLPFIP